MKKIAALLLFIGLLSCQSKSQDLNVLFTFPESLKEVSGMVYHNENKLIYVLEDKGNENMIYSFDTLGNQINKIKILGVENTDWEDLSVDANGNLYIGNFGNNDNKRTDLAIYKIAKEDLNLNSVTPIQTISFNYPEQTSFPPKKNNLLFDCEAFVIIDSSLYLFTKNRSKNFDGTFFVYKIDNTNGDYKAEKISELNSGTSFKKSAITGAAYNIASKTIALTTHTNAILIKYEDDLSFKQENLKFVDYNHNSQKESITFKNKNTLLIADEKEKKNDIGGNVYEFNLLD